MATFWFWIIAAMLAVYAILDGFDLGAGVIDLFVAHTDAERRMVMRAIGPVWDGNEVWLLAGGGLLFMSFPGLYAASFSGFYLPLTVVLWLLILRGISLEFRNHIESPVWAPLWDVVFALASTLLTIFFGAALGNVIRGVPLDASGYFFLPLWTNFRPGPNPGILDWFTIVVGVATLFAVAEHGALWVAMKTGGELEARCRRVAAKVWWPMLAFTLLVPAVSPLVQPQLLARFSSVAWGYVFPVLIAAGLFGCAYFNRPATGWYAFACSCLYVLGVLGSTAFGLYPFVLPSNVDLRFGLTVYNAAAPLHSLKIGLVWFIPGIILAAVYLTVAYRSFAGKVGLDESGQYY